MIDLIKNLTNNFAYVIIMAFFISNIPLFKNVLQRDEYRRRDFIILIIIFGGFGIIGTYAGTEVNGAIANTRIVGVMAGGIIFGPYVGIFAGIIAGVHRLLIDINGITSIPCAITTILAGFLSGYIYKKASIENKKIYGLLGGILVESLEMILILIFSKPYSSALTIVKSIYLPMSFANGIGISILVAMIQSNFREKDEIAAKQAKLALEIASKTLPYFRDINSESLLKVCEIIKNSTGSGAVSITDKEFILAHAGLGSDHHVKGEKIKDESTKKVIFDGELIVLNKKYEINCDHPNCPLKSVIIVPLRDGNDVVGTLKLFYSKENRISFSNINLAKGLSSLISTQYEISKVSKLKELATKSEIKALQAQINPHFLFNSFNTIISFLRFDPNKARELIIDLSTYLRYNLDYSNSYVELYKELEQVKAYLQIEKARFGDKLEIIFNIEENIDILVPSLIIQPIVENSIKHGILNGRGSGKVEISIISLDEGKVYISVEDNGKGIDEETIDRIYNDKMKENKIGITNVNKRLKYIYGKGLNIERLDKGTKISFIIYDLKEEKDELHNS